MPSSTAIRNKISAVLSRLQATSRVVQFRSVSSSGGNALLGVGQSVSVTDTVCDPQPVVELLTPEAIAASGALLQLGDYRLLFDGNVTEDTLKTNEILYGDDVLKVLSYNPVAIGGEAVAWTVLARTVKAA